jgi:NhaA family Na+:H+ antiporter
MENPIQALKRKPASALRNFINSEAAGGIILMLVAALAMLIANSPLARLVLTGTAAAVVL